MIKKFFLIIIIVFSMTTNVQAEVVSIDDFDISKSLEVFNNTEYSNLDLDVIIKKISNGKILDTVKYIWKCIYTSTIGNVATVEKTIINLVLIILISAFFTNFASVFSKDNISDTGFYICFLIVITFIVTLFDVFADIATSFVSTLLQFVGAIIPVYLLSVGLFSQVTATGYYQIIVVIIAVVQFLFLNVVLPLIKIYLAISLVNNISKEDLLSKTSELIKKIVDFLNKALLGLITGLNMLQCLILPTIDQTKNSSIKKIIGSLPVVGDGTEAFGTILTGSVNLIKNTIGVFAICVIIVICAIPYIKILLYSFSMNIATALIQPIADNRITQSLSYLNSSIGMLLKVIVTNGVLFIISIAIVCMFTSM